MKRKDLILLKPAKLNGHVSSNEVVAPLTGKVMKINIQIMEKVNKGDVLMIVESMKMENHIIADCAGIVEKIFVNQGDKVSGRDILAIVNAS